ncbi:MAG: crosslink repair DNA glycosylase YcaQ family protein [Halanaerobium sp.]|nr:crosslink repair DNA glycosylase YcaQ family protein [Halanaerobium sp.]
MGKVKPLDVTIEQARTYILAYQKLLPPRRLAGKGDIMEYIQMVGCIQFDPLDVVGRNPDLVLQSRVKGYRPELLEELLYTDRELLDGWDKNMSIYPVADWPYFTRYRQRASHKYMGKSEHIKEILPAIKDKLMEDGPLSSLDLNFDKKVAWAWAPARAGRAALESMYSRGEVVVAHRIGSRKYYGLSEDYLPVKLLNAREPNPTREDYLCWHIKRRIAGIGLLWDLSGDAWLGIKGLDKQARVAAINRLKDEGQICEVNVAGLKNLFYISSEAKPLLEEVIEGVVPAKEESYDEAAIIAPLDNLLWDRKLIKRLFGFSYVWEVYKPEEERKYGYYVLPVIYGNRFIARFEPKMVQDEKKLVIKKWWWEDDVDPDPKMARAVMDCLAEFKDYLGAGTVELGGNFRLLGRR